jgi:hypothetical protein
MADDNTDLLGKKVFFLHPSAFTQNEIITELIQQEHEVYIVRDEAKLKKMLQCYPQSVLFACVNEVLSQKDWETLIRGIMGDEKTRETAVGVIVTTENDAEKRFYLNTLRVSCGYVAVKPNTIKAAKVLLDILKAADAKGRRKYIRADTRDMAAAINLPYDGKFINGVINDISVVGLSCVFSEDLELSKNSLYQDIQIKLQSSIMKVEGIVFGSRMDEGKKVYVIILTQKVDYAVRSKIRAYIQKNLQAKMDLEFK